MANARLAEPAMKRPRECRLLFKTQFQQNDPVIFCC